MAAMNRPVLLLCLLSYALLASLPLVFFRRGRFNHAWFATAAPFIGAAAVVTAALAGVLSPVQLPHAVQEGLAYVAVVIVAGAILLIGCTAGVHRAPVSLWHQREDTPTSLVTCGPYTRLRHPFYTAFIMMLIGTVAALPHAVTVGLLLAGTLGLRRTAEREERRILASPHGLEYAAYMCRTGRFLPRLVTAGSGARERLRRAERLRSRARPAQTSP
jgi:protein-S-isoprenylcysteine O-methyltransferase Ste14